MSRILLYNIHDEKLMKIRVAALRLGLETIEVPPESFGHPLGHVLGFEGYEPSDAAEPFDEEMLVMETLSSPLLDALRAGGAPVALKAVVTEQIKTGLADVTVDAAYRTGLLYRPLWEFGGETTDLDYALDMIGAVKEAAASALPTLPEPLPLLYGGTLTAPQLKDLYEKQIIDGYFADAANMTPEEFTELIDAVGNV